MKPVCHSHSPVLLAVLTVPLSILPLAAQADYNRASPFDISIHTGMGVDTGSLRWSIAGDPQGSTGPDILSELSYRDLNFKVYRIQGDIQIHQGWLRGSNLFVDYKTGRASAGEVQDSDYTGNNRTREYSRSLSSARDSTLDVLELGIGYRIPLGQTTSLLPAIALTRQQQSLKMTNGQQTVDTRDPGNLGRFRGTLDSTYDTEWLGGWAGLSWEYKTRYQRLSLGYRYYRMDYHAEADWNLRTDFAHPKSFEHWAVGGGGHLDLAWTLHLTSSLALNASWFRQEWSTGTGRDRVYLANGTTASSQLNDVNWQSEGYNLGLQLAF